MQPVKTSAIVVAAIAFFSVQSIAQDTQPRREQVSNIEVADRDFGVSGLPEISTISAKTGIRGFMQPGVPHVIRVAALRRAWSADPAIRDFKGMAENEWDFTAADVPSFGAIDPNFDAEGMVAQMLSAPRLAAAEKTGLLARASFSLFRN